MSNNPLIPQSKLPNLGTTIFTQMSALAQQHQAINLSQGFPDFDGPLFLQERLAYHVAHGANQYAPMTGVQPLREAIADKTADLYGYKPDANSEVTITAGATTAMRLRLNYPAGWLNVSRCNHRLFASTGRLLVPYSATVPDWLS